MKRIAVYAGSFDPPTLGHLDVIRRVQPHFDEVHLVIAINSRKQALFSTEERIRLLNESAAEILPSETFHVSAHQGLIVDYCKTVGAKVLIRGLRALSDFESELQMATMNRRLGPEIETLHVMTDEKYFFLSSSLVKELAQHKANLSEIVPLPVLKALQKKVSS